MVNETPTPSPRAAERTPWTVVAGPWAALVVCSTALCFTPEWLPAEESSAAAFVVRFSEGARERVAEWLDPAGEGPRLPAGAAFGAVEVCRDRLRVPLRDATGAETGRLELWPKHDVLGDDSSVRSRSFTIFEIPETDHPDVREALHRAASAIARADDGGVVRSVRVEPARNVPDEYRALGIGLFAALVALALRDRFRLPSPAGAVVKRTHLLPAALQITILTYWAIYWRPVEAHVPMIGAQLFFAYALDVVSAWALRRPWPGHFAVVAPVLSANLFVWFTGGSAWEGFLVMALAIGSKALLRREGRHVFNPSAFGTAVVGLLVLFGPLLFGREQFGYTDVAFGLSAAPSMSEVMFLVTLVPLTLLGTSYIAIGGVVGLTLLQKLTGHGPDFAWPGWFLAITDLRR